MMTKEQALEIVKKAEAEYDPHNKGSNLVDCVVRMVGWDYSVYDDEVNRWQWEGDWGLIEYATSEQVAEMLANQVNNVENLLFMVGR